jgi:ferredoxin
MFILFQKSKEVSDMQILRKIIEIDEELCNGCGQCVPSCAEGAIEIIKGKARIVADKFCDGLGACLGECPTGALKIVERVAEDFDEKAAHDFVMKKRGSEMPAEETMACGCPSAFLQSFASMTSPCQKANIPKSHAAESLDRPVSALSHWPVQINLIPPSAPFLKGANLLVAADCVPVAYPDFHNGLLQGKTVMMGCPKFDDAQAYMERFAEIFKKCDIRDITLAIMEVPCCSAMDVIIRRAMEKADKNLPIRKVVISTRGKALSS